MMTALGLAGTPKASLSLSSADPSITVFSPTTGLGCPTTRTPPALGSATIQGQVQSDQGETEEREPGAGSPEVGAGSPGWAQAAPRWAKARIQWAFSGTAFFFFFFSKEEA